MRAASACAFFLRRVLVVTLIAAAPVNAGFAESDLFEHFKEVRARSTTVAWCTPSDSMQGIDVTRDAPRYFNVRGDLQADASPAELFQRVLDSFADAKHPLETSLVIDSAVYANAYIRGDREVVVTTPLLKTVLDRSELAFIFAHEMAHIALHHTDNDSVENEIAADALALSVVSQMGYNPCAGADVLDRLSAPLSASLVSVSPRLKAIHQESPDDCG